MTLSESFAGSRNGQGDIPTGARALKLWHAKCYVKEPEPRRVDILCIIAA
jgi:hypothetical protein